MGPFLRLIAVFVITIKRMYTQRGLVLANALGVLSAVALTMSIPVYADAVYQNILEREITPLNPSEGSALARPSFAFLYRYIGSWAGSLDWTQAGQVDDYLNISLPGELGLNSRLHVRYLKTDQLMLFPAGKDSYRESPLPLDFLYVATITGQEEHITLSEGRLPQPGAQPVEVLMRVDRANELGVQSGEEYNLLAVLEKDGQKERVEIPIRIVGVWQASDPSEPYWFYSSGEFAQVLLVAEETLLGDILPQIRNEVGLAVWYWVMDPSTVQSSEVDGLLARIDATRRRSEAYLPKIRLDVSPEDALFEYRQAAGSLTIFLYAFSIPLLVMILIFISLVMNMAVGQRRNEIAVLRSRGSTVAQLAGMAVLESALLIAVALAAGSPAAEAIAQLLGRARSFLDFSSPAELHAQVNISALRFGLVAGLIALAAQVLPTLGAARNTIVNYKRDRARSISAAWWKRAYIDVLLLIPAGYGIYLLRQNDTGLPSDPFQNPLLLLIPSLAIFALTLVILRLLPLLMRLVAWLAGFTGSVGLLMAARTLARTSGSYSAPLILLAMTLSLSTFTATMAQTLDHDTYDHTYYQVGADVSISYIENQAGTGMPGAAQPAETGTANAGPRWFFLPVTEHLTVPGVEAAARVAHTTVQMGQGSSTSIIRYIGIDWSDFPRVAFWRRDFASQPLGALMNAMGASPEGVLVSRDLLQTHNLQVGDGLFLSAYEAGQNALVPFRIVGVIDYFPTWYPSDGPLIVGSLDYLFTQVGSEFPYDVWLKTAPGVNYGEVVQGIDNLYRSVLHTQVAPEMITREQLRPERQGFFGLLSVGFSALSLMSVVGFFLYALFSFRQRFVELGMLRAIGLSVGQMLMLLASELAFLFLTGLAAGTGLGAWISDLFIPYLQIGSQASARVPPFLVQINWLAVYQVYALFAALFVVALVVLAVMLARMKIFQAIKLGEVV